MDSILNLCIIGFIVLIGLVIVMMMMRNFGGGNRYNQYGSETPRYDDPNVRSRGWFGGRGGPSGGVRGGESPQYDSPNVQSRGWFGRRSGGSNSGGSTSVKGGSVTKSSSGSGSYNSPNVKSRGGFGGKK